MKEEHFFFEIKKMNHFGVLYTPTVKRSNNGVVILHPFAEEKKNTQHFLVLIARAICQKGIHVLLFDNYGCGDSYGEFKDSSLSLWIRNISDVLKFFERKTGCNIFQIIGLRLGAYIALRVFETVNANITRLLLLEPVFDPLGYFHAILRQKIINEVQTYGFTSSSRNKIIDQLKKQNQSIDFEGYEVCANFYNDLLKNKIIINVDSKSTEIILFHLTLKRNICKEYILFLRNNINVKYAQDVIVPFWNRIEKPDYANLITKLSNIF